MKRKVLRIINLFILCFVAFFSYGVPLYIRIPSVIMLYVLLELFMQKICPE